MGSMLPYIAYMDPMGYTVHCSVVTSSLVNIFSPCWTPPFLRKSPFVVDGLLKCPFWHTMFLYSLLLQYNVCEHNIILNLLLASWWNEPWDGQEPHFCRSPPCFQDFSCSFWCPFYHPKLRVVRSASGREHDSARGQGEGERRVTPLRFTWNRNPGSLSTWQYPLVN